jgi:CO/xanthine dehydrogenase Mo-binding subunit
MRYVGKSIPRPDAVKKVTGGVEYAIDSRMSGMLYARLFRSTVAHGRILRVDASRARAVPGVMEVITAADMPQPTPCFGPVIADQPLLASGEVRFFGEPVAVVLATDDDAALEGARRIEAEYEELPAVCSVAQALDPGAPLLHPGGRDHHGNLCQDNRCGQWLFGWGDVDGARRGCPHIVADAYCFPMVNHHSLEPFCAIAYPAGAGVEIRSPIQSPFILRRVVSACLGIELADVWIIPSEIGGGFGSKGYAKLEPLAAYLALHTRRPVKISTSFNEGFLTVRRLSSEITVTTGLDGQGRIVFQDVIANYLIGAYADAGSRIAQKAGFLGCGPYRVPHLRVLARALYSHTVPSTAARGFGMPQMVWAIENQMNVAARRLGLDPLEIRLRNLPAKGEELVPGDTPCDGQWADALRQAAAMVGWGQPKAAHVGRGVAIGIKNPIQASVSNAIVKLYADGTLSLAVGTTEMGQGARTVLAQIAAEVLGVAFEQITVIMGDTGVAPFDLATAGSRSTVTMGNAVIAACHDLLRQLRALAFAAGIFAPGEAVEAGEGRLKGATRSVSYGEALRLCRGPNPGELVGAGLFQGTADPKHALGGKTDFWELVFTSAEVEVNPTTGKVTVTRLANVSDAGKVINPLQAEAQEEGGLVMGLGHTLTEELLSDARGRLRNASPLDYRIPTMKDIPPEIQTHWLENEDGPGPFGAKGIGEGGAIAVAPAVGGAVMDAMGIVIRELPFAAEKVWRALHVPAAGGTPASRSQEAEGDGKDPARASAAGRKSKQTGPDGRNAENQ